MARVPDPPDLVKALARIRRWLRRIPLDHPERERLLELTADIATVNAKVALIPPSAPSEPIITPEDTLREAGVCSRRQATYQRKFSTLLAGKAGA